jgi:hypothetical protein
VQSVQSIIDNNVGHCLAWSLFFVLMRLLNHKLALQRETISEFIHRFLVSIPVEQLDDIVKKFITYVKTFFPLTKRHYSNFITLDIHNTLTNVVQENIENRLSQISQVYFKKLLNSSEQDITVLFAEIASYKNLPNFHRIMANSMKTVSNIDDFYFDSDIELSNYNNISL